MVRVLWNCVSNVIADEKAESANKGTFSAIRGRMTSHSLLLAGSPAMGIPKAVPSILPSGQ